MLAAPAIAPSSLKVLVSNIASILSRAVSLPLRWCLFIASAPPCCLARVRRLSISVSYTPSDAADERINV